MYKFFICEQDFLKEEKKLHLNMLLAVLDIKINLFEFNAVDLIQSF